MVDICLDVLLQMPFFTRNNVSIQFDINTP